MKKIKQFKCVKNLPGYWLTLGKIYSILLDYTNGKHIILNDKNYEHFLFKDDLEINFIDIQLVRQVKLNELGI